MRLLITRPEEDAAPLAERLRALGHDAFIEPLLAIVNLEGVPLDLDGAQALLVTSANGVRAFAAAESRRDLPVLAVGDSSARVSRELGFTDVASAGGDVDDLARLAAARLDPARGALLHVAGSKLAGDLAGLLEAAGFAYRRAVLYEARPATALSEATRAALAARRMDGILFFSPRTARTFVTLIDEAGLEGELGAVSAFCLSRAVALQVSALSWAAVRIAERPDQESLIARIQAT